MSFGWRWKWAGVAALGGLLTINGAEAQQPTIAADDLTKSIQSGSQSNPAPQPKPPEALLLPNANQLTQLDEAYLDAFSILKEVSACSAFYGGPSAILVLNRLTQQLKPTHLHRNRNVAVRMSGERVTITSFPYGLSYRLFAKAELNLAGPFYRSRDLSSSQSIGGFLPNTREARVIILLHELGHLIQKRDNEWLLTDDGGNESLSQENSKRVVGVCGKQINDLRRISFAQELLAAQTPDTNRK
jgi:hypothetical protein